MARPADPHAKSALVAAARAEFVKHGIGRARIEDITSACGLSKGAFYLHYESKEALFREVVTGLMGAFEVVRGAREAAYGDAVASLKASGAAAPDPAYLAQLSALDAREDRRLLELMWDWRDVIDVLLRGCQGTEFDGVMWQMLDVEVERVRQECEEMKKVGLIRDDVHGEVIGMMVVGTYMLVARKLSQATERPDFDALVASLQQVVSQGMTPRPQVRPPARRATRTPVRSSRNSRKRSPR